MKILVTGGAGFIGSHIVDQYIAAGHDVAVIDNLWSEGGGTELNLPHQAQFYHADITDQTTLTRIFDEVQPEIVSHQAAQHTVAISTQNPQLDAQVNVLGLLNILTNCTRTGTKKIIFASSAATYGTPAHVPINEDTPQRPESPYGITKMVAEHYLRYWQQANGLTFTALRYGNVYGPRQSPEGEAGVIATFIKRFLNHETIRIDGDGEQCRDFIFVKDVALANLQALHVGHNDIFCIGTGTSTTINRLYRMLARLTNFTPEVLHAPKRSGDIDQSYFTIEKAERALNWQPKTTVENGLRATLDFFRMQQTL